MAEQVERLLNIPDLIHQYIDGSLDAREIVVDILTETFHFAFDQGVDMSYAIDSAHRHFDSEKAEEIRSSDG